MSRQTYTRQERFLPMVISEGIKRVRDILTYLYLCAE